MRSSTETLIAALRILARDIRSTDGIANAAIREAADRLKELDDALADPKRQVQELHARILILRNEAADARKGLWRLREFDPEKMAYRHYGREQALSQVLSMMEELL